MTVRAARALPALLLLLCCMNAKGPDRPTAAARAVVETAAGGRHEVRVELARTDAERARGLMWRERLEPDAGMLFLFDETELHGFWMKNTLIPLDLIFIGEDGRIVGIVESAAPQTETLRDVGAPSRYVLEVNGGWSAARGVRAGDRVKFDPLKDLAPVSWISSTPLVLVIHPSVPAKSVQELVATAKRTGKMNAGSNGAGTTSHLSIEMLKQMTGIDVAHIPYKGGGPSMAALMGGETDFLFATGPVAAAQVKAGRVHALAVTTAKKSSAFPDLPTMSSIYPGFESDNWYAMFFPARTPKPIVDRLNAEIAKALKADDIRAFMVREALDPVASSPEALRANFEREIARYAKIIKAGNITVQ